MSNNSPYSVVNGPDYGSGLVNWSQMGQIGGANPQQRGVPSPAQVQNGAGTPAGIPSPAQAQNGAGAPNTVGPPSQAQQQMQGLGQKLMMMLGLGGGGQGDGGNTGAPTSIGNPTSLAPQQPAPQPAAPINPASPYGLY